MNFFVVPREIRKIDKRGGGQNKLWGVCKNHEKNKHPPPVYFEPESIWTQFIKGFVSDE